MGIQATIAAGLVLFAAAGATGRAEPAAPRATARPFSFEENAGQLDPGILFLTRGRAHTLLFGRDEVVFARRSGRDPKASSLRLRFQGGRPDVQVTGDDRLPGQTYYAPAGARGRLTGHPTFGRVRYTGVYPGIDVVYYGREEQLEFDLEIAAHADPSVVALSLDGATDLAIAPSGDLTFRAGDEPVTLRRPVVYQEADGVRTEVRAAYVLQDRTRVAFALGAYDRSRPLVVDPVFQFGSAGDDVVRGVEVNAAGGVFLLAETTDSSGVGWGQVEPAQGSQATQCYLAKFDAASTTPLYTILFGGTTTCTTLALSPNGVAYFPGYEFPVIPNLHVTTLVSVDDTSGAPVIGRVQVNNYDPFRNQVGAMAADVHENVYLLGQCRVVDPAHQPPLDLNGFNDAPDAGSGQPTCVTGSSQEHALLTKVAPGGTVEYATFLAADDRQRVAGAGLAVDGSEHVFVVRPRSAAVPVTAEAFRPACSDSDCGYLLVIDTTTTGPGSLLHASYLWPMDVSGARPVARLGPTGSLYLASSGPFGPAFPATNFNPYGDFPRQIDVNTGLAVTAGLQLARFDFDGSGAPNVLRYARSVNYGPPTDTREHLADLRVLPSGAVVVGALANSPDPGGSGRRFDGYFLTYYPSGVLALDASGWRHSMSPNPSGVDPTFAMALTSTGEPVTAIEWPLMASTPWDILVEVDAVSLDPGANTPPFLNIAPLQQTVETSDPTGAIVPGYLAAFDWDESAGHAFGIAANCTHTYNITRFPVGTTHAVCTAQDDDGVVVTQAYDVTVNLHVNTTTANTPIPLVDLRGPASNAATPGRVTVTFQGAVDPSGPGLTWLRTRTDQRPLGPPAGLQLGSSPFYYEIGTTAVTTGAIELCFDLTGMSFAVPSAVGLHHLAGSAWTDVTSASDLAAHRMCTVAADANELGTFALFTPADERTRVEILAGIGVPPGNYETGAVPAGDGGPATAAALSSPSAVAFDVPRNAMYIADGRQVRRVDLQTGIITRYAGLDQATPFGNVFGNPVEGGPATATEFMQVDTVAVDRDGNVFLAEAQSCVIQRIDRVTGLVRNVAGAWTGDQPGSCGYTGDGGEARAAKISLAGSLVFDAEGNLLFTQSSGLPQEVTTGTPGFIRRIAAGADHLIKGRPQETISTIAGNGQLAPTPGSPLASGMAPGALALGRAGELYVTSYSNILRIVPAQPHAPLVGGPSETLQVVAGGDVLARLPFNGDQRHPLDADLLLMSHLAVLPSGELLISHWNSKRVRLVTPGADGAADGSPDERITTLAGFSDLVLPPGPLDLSGYSPTGYALSTVFFPSSATPDPRGGIVVADPLRHYVSRFGYVPLGLSLSTAALDFGPQTLGTTSSPRTVTVTNASDNPLAVTGVAATGDYTVSASNCAALAPAASCAIQVSFSPTGLGSRSGELQIMDSLLTVHRITMAGIGRGIPAVSLTPASLTFGNQLVGTSSPPQAVTLANTGNGDLTIAAIAIAGADFLHTTACPPALGPGLSCTIDVVLHPVSHAGVHGGELRVASDAARSPHVVTLTGYGDTRTLSVSSTAVEFGLVNVGSTSPASTITLTNTGTTPLSLGDIRVVGDTTAGFIDTVAETLASPHAMAVDARGTIFFATEDGAVSRLDAATRLVTTVWTRGDTAHVADGGGVLDSPVALATDRAGHLYVAEHGNFLGRSQVRRVDAATGAITVVAGNGFEGSGGNGGPALAASVSPAAIAVDGAGNLFIADAPASGALPATIRRVDADTGVITLIAGGGTDAFFSDGAGATSVRLFEPRAMAVDAAGNVFLQQGGSAAGVVVRVEAASGTVARWANLAPPAETGQFALAVATPGRLFVSTDHRVVRIDGPLTAPVNVVGPSSPGPGNGDGGPAGQAWLRSAAALAFDAAGNLYLADGPDRRIRRMEAFTSLGATAFPLTSDCGTSLMPFPAHPSVTTCTVTVTFAAAAPGARRAAIQIQHDGANAPARVSLSGTGARPLGVASPASVTFAPTPVGATSERFVMVTNSGNAPLAFGGFQLPQNPAFTLTHDCAPTLAAGRSCRARIVFAPSSQGQTSSLLRVTYGLPETTVDVPLFGVGAPPPLMVSPSALVFPPTLVGTSATASVNVQATGSATVSSIVVTGADDGDFEAGACIPPFPMPPGTPLFCTIAVTFRPTVTGDRTARLQIVDDQGTPPYVVTLDGTGGNTLPSLLVVNPPAADFGRVAAGAAEHRMIEVHNVGGLPVTLSQLSIDGPTTTAERLRTLAGDGVAGVGPDGFPAASAHLGEVYDVAVDRAGKQYLADASLHRIWRIDVLTGLIHSIAGTGGAGFGGDGGPSTAATFNRPTSVAVDALGRVYVADSENHRVRRIAPFAGFGPFGLEPTPIVTIAGNGTPGYSGDGGPATQASLHGPQGLAIDNEGNLLIADTLNHVVRRVTANGMISTVVGDGIAGAGVGAANGAPLRLSAPVDVAVGPDGLLVVADAGNARVLWIDRPLSADRVVQERTWGPAGSQAVPGGVAVSALGRVFFSDTTGHRLLTFDVLGNSGTGGTTNVFAGNGQSGWQDAPDAVLGRLSQPQGLAVDASGHVLIADTGNRRLRRVDGVSTTMQTEFSATGCLQALLPGETCEIDVSFTPTFPGVHRATLTLASDSVSGPRTVDLAGIGTQPAPYLGWPPSFLGVEVGTTRVKTWRFANGGTAPLSVSSVGLAGALPSPFSMSSNCLPSLDPGAGCTIEITFAPTTVGTQAVTLEIFHSGLALPRRYGITGDGVPARTQTTLASSSPAGTSVFGEAVTFAVGVTSLFQTPSGTVSFEGTPTPVVPDLTLDGGGLGSSTTALLPAGTHVLQARYTGDALHAASTSPALTHTVARQSTATALSAGGTTLTYGQILFLTGTVSSPTAGPITGSIRFDDGGVPLDPEVVTTGGTAGLAIVPPAGSRTYGARYLGDANSEESVSNAVTVAVAKATTTTTLAAETSPAFVNFPATFTATVTPRFGGAVAGAVTFRSGNTVLGVVPVVGGRASLTRTFALPQTAVLTAAYGGDSNLLGSTSAPLLQPVLRVPTTLTVTPSPNPSYVGQTVTFTVTVTSPKGPPPDGQQVLLGGAVPTLVVLNLVGGSASYVTSSLPTGGRFTIAIYAGSTTFAPSSSYAVHEVRRRATTVVVTSSPSPSAYGQAVTFQASVSSAAEPPPDGQLVTFTVQGLGQRTAALSGGIARLTTAATALSVGAHTATARYAGDATFEARTSDVVSHVVTPGVTTTTLTSSPNPSTFGTRVTFTAVVTSTTPGIVPAGSVTFRRITPTGSVTLGTSALNSTARATLQTQPSGLPRGNWTITATYTPSPANFTASAGSLVQGVQ